MSLFAIAHALITFAALGLLLRRREVSELLTQCFSSRDLLVYLGLAVAAAMTSLGSFDAISNHAFRPHEEAYYFALQGEAPPEGWNPLETQVLLRLIYQGVGQVFGDSMTVFVGTALLLGLWGASLAGAAAQLMTRSRWIGYSLCVLLVLHPDLSYWRINAFQIAAPHSAFCLTLLLATIAARKPSPLSLASWLICASFAVALRPDNLGSVAASAAIPLLLGPPGLQRQLRMWLPGFCIGAGFVLIPTLANIELAQNREDYHWGLAFLPTHLSVISAYRPLSSPGIALLITVGLAGSARNQLMPPELRRVAIASALIMLCGLFPDILFGAFGKRHLLGSNTAGLLLALCGAGLLAHQGSNLAPGLAGRRGLNLVLVALLCSGAIGEIRDLRDLGSRYGDNTPYIPALPDTARPTSELDTDGRPSRSLPVDLEKCGLYSGETYICDPWALNEGATCHPPKNLREPAEVRRLWDAQGGCVLWAVDDTCDDVSGVMADWWEMVRHLYRWQPVGILPIQERNSHVEVYRLIQRP